MDKKQAPLWEFPQRSFFIEKEKFRNGFSRPFLNVNFGGAYGVRIITSTFSDFLQNIKIPISSRF